MVFVMWDEPIEKSADMQRAGIVLQPTASNAAKLPIKTRECRALSSGSFRDTRRMDHILQQN
jgi:hypothetical protein